MGSISLIELEKQDYQKELNANIIEYGQQNGCLSEEQMTMRISEVHMTYLDLTSKKCYIDDLSSHKSYLMFHLPLESALMVQLFSLNCMYGICEDPRAKVANGYKKNVSYTKLKLVDELQ